jgi:hypothetical protein
LTVTLPIPTNVTCDVYKSGNAPPAPPDVAGLAGNLQPWPRNIHTFPPYTHWLDVPLNTIPALAVNSFLYVPNKNGTKFKIVGYERIRGGAAGDWIRLYLDRQAVNWPSQDL